MQKYRFLAQAALAAAVVLVTAPAFAQYYQQAPRYGYQQPPTYDYAQPPAPRYGYQEPAPGYYRQPRYGRPAYRQQVYGGICYTKRGSCELGGSLPVGSYCRCDIPFFGSKQGEVVQ